MKYPIFKIFWIHSNGQAKEIIALITAARILDKIFMETSRNHHKNEGLRSLYGCKTWPMRVDDIKSYLHLTTHA